MTRDGKFKKQVRARMRSTGENYHAALVALRPPTLAVPAAGDKERVMEEQRAGLVRETVARVLGREPSMEIREREGHVHVILDTVGAADAVDPFLLANLQREVALAVGDPGAVVRARLEATTCSFCGKRREDVEQLVFGVYSAICDDCVELAMTIVTQQRAGAKGADESR